jgi:hypothetical protein
MRQKAEQSEGWSSKWFTKTESHAKTPRHSAAEPQPNGNAFNAETPRTQRAAELFL